STATPSTNTFPSSGESKQPKSDSSEVFPLPDGPITNESVPGSNAADTPRNARTLAFPLPNERRAPSTASSRLGTEHPPRIDRKRTSNRSYRCERAHQ